MEKNRKTFRRRQIPNALVYYIMVLSSIFSRGSFSQMGGSKDLISLIAENRGFLFKIFANLIGQLGITYYVMNNTESEKNVWVRLGYILMTLVLVIIIAATNIPIWAKLLLFTVFSAVFGKLMTRYKEKYGEQVVNAGIMGAMYIFAAMFLVGAMLPTLGPQVGLALFVALLALIVARIVSWFSNKTDTWKKWLSGAGIGIFGLYVAYDTNNILRRASYYQGDFVTASMDYYLDIINLVQDVIGYNNN